MGGKAGNNQTAGVATGKATLLARSSIWKSAIVIAPLAATALFIASGTQAHTSGSSAQQNRLTDATTVAPKPAPVAARKRRGPKEKTKEDTGRTASPPTEPTTSTPVAPIDAPAAARRKGPKVKVKEISTRVASPPPAAAAPVAPIDAPDAARRGGPKGGGRDKILVGRTEAPAPDSTPVERRKEGPKGDGESGRTEAPAPDTQPAGRRRKGPKGAVDHGRTSTTPLIIGALGAATVLALVVSSGNDRPASP